MIMNINHTIIVDVFISHIYRKVRLLLLLLLLEPLFNNEWADRVL